MSDVRDLIRAKIAEKGLSFKAVSEQIGRNHSYLQQYVTRHIPRQLHEDDRARLAPILGVMPDQLKESRGGKSLPSNRVPMLRIPSPVPGDRIPVLGASEGGPDGLTIWNGEVVDYIDRPPQLAGATQGFATYVVGSSMEPRYYQGELIFMHPGKPASPGDFVLVEMRPDSEGEAPRAFVKRLVRRTATKVVLAQFNPAREIEVALKDVIRLYKVVGSGIGG